MALPFNLYWAYLGDQLICTNANQGETSLFLIL